MIKTKFAVSLVIAVWAMAVLTTGSLCLAQDSKSPTVLPVPSAGKAIVCVYRTYRFTGSASHDDIFINGTHLGRLLSDEYEFLEVSPGTVVISGLPKMYYAGGVVMSSYTAISNASKKENERARFEAEAGKTYYFKWTAGAMETGIKVTPEDPSVGAKEIRKLHLSKPVDDKQEVKPNTDPRKTEESSKPGEPAKPADTAKPAESPESHQNAKPN